MYPVSRKFQEKIRKQFDRRTFGKIQINYTSPFLDQSITVAVNENANVSFPSQTADSVPEPFAKIASLDGSWVLDGTYALAPATTEETETKQMGWWGKQLAGIGGAFSAPYPTLTVTFLPRPIAKLQAVGDSKRQEWPVDFNIKLYDGNNTLLHTETVTGNTEIVWSRVLDEPITQVEKMTLEITKWSHAGRQVKILEFFTSIQETYEDDDIIFIHLLEEREVSHGSLPVGNISSNEIYVELNNANRKFDVGNTESPLYQLLKPNRRIKAWLGVEVDDMIVSGSISPYFDSNSIRPYIDALRLNTVNVPVKVIVPDVSSSLMSIEQVSKEAAIEVVQYLKSQGMKVILEPFPWIADGTIPETEWQPSDINLWFWNWKTTILQPLIEEIANPYGVEYLNVASNYVNMEYATGYWQDTFAFVRSLYSGKIIYRTNWWVTAVWAPETIQAYYNKLYNPLFGDPNLDIISIACYFELTDTPVPSVDELLQCLRSTTKYSRQQNVYQEIKNFYEVWGKPIFFGELGVASYERCASEPWNVIPSSTYSEEAQSNCFQAYMEMFLEEPWFTGFSVYCIGDTISPYSVLNKAAEIVIRSWRRTKKEWVPLGVFWSGDWSAPEDRAYAQTTGRDRLEFLRRSEYIPDTARQNISLYDLAVDILTDAGLTQEEYWVDDELKDYIIPYVGTEPQSHREALRKVAEACLGNVYCDRHGVIRVEGTKPITEQNFVTASENANISYPSQVVDGIENPDSKYASLDGSWELDGSFVLAPETEGPQMGWWGKQLSGPDGSFAEPYPTLMVTFFERAIEAVKVVGDSARDEYPVDFTIRIFDGNNNLLSEQQVTGNAQVATVVPIPENPTNAAKIELSIQKWSHPGRQAKILEFLNTINKLEISPDDYFSKDNPLRYTEVANYIVVETQPVDSNGNKLPGVKVIAKDDESITENGLLPFEFPANPLVQTVEMAEEIAGRLLEIFKDPRRNLELDWRGNPAVLLGDVVSVVDSREKNDYKVIRQEIEYDGTLRARLTGRRI